MTRWTPERPSAGDFRRVDEIELGKNRSVPGLCLAVQFQGRRPAEKGGLLSGGERNRVHLAKMLKSGANVLPLDEPTNDLDVETLRALEPENFAGCAVIISHDRWFLDRLATHILAFEGTPEVVWFEGNTKTTKRTKNVASAPTPTGRAD